MSDFFLSNDQLSNLSRQISVAFILTTSTRTLVKSDITGRGVGYHDLNKKAFQVLRSKDYITGSPLSNKRGVDGAAHGGCKGEVLSGILSHNNAMTTSN